MTTQLQLKILLLLFYKLYPGIYLTTEEKAGKTLSQRNVLSSDVFSGLFWLKVKLLKTVGIMVSVIFKFPFGGGGGELQPGTPTPWVRS